VMSAIGPKRTSVAALHMSVFGGKADTTVCGKSAFAVAIGAKRTCPFALHMSPKADMGGAFPTACLGRYDASS
jgi:hypothetical protein